MKEEIAVVLWPLPQEMARMDTGGDAREGDAGPRKASGVAPYLRNRGCL